MYYTERPVYNRSVRKLLRSIFQWKGGGIVMIMERSLSCIKFFCTGNVWCFMHSSCAIVVLQMCVVLVPPMCLKIVLWRRCTKKMLGTPSMRYLLRFHIFIPIRYSMFLKHSLNAFSSLL